MGGGLDNRGGIGHWLMDSSVVDWLGNVVDIGGGQTSGVDQGRISLSLSLGDSGGGSWNSVDQGVGEWEGVVDSVDKGGVDSSVVDNWVVDGSVVDNWGGGNSLDHWGVDSGVVDGVDQRDGVDGSLDNWNIVDAGDGVGVVDQGSRTGNIAGHWVDNMACGVEKSWISLSLGLSISGSLSIVSIGVWVSIGSVSIWVTISSSIWVSSISVCSVEKSSVSFGFRLSLWLSISQGG